MASGIDFAGSGGDDVSNGPMTTGQPAKASRGQQGPVDFAGDGGMDVGGTISDTSTQGTMPPKGGDVEFAGDIGEA